MTGKNFCSDNVAGASPEIVDALAKAATGAAMPYGNDAMTADVQKKFCDIFETDVEAHLVATGTAANSLALSSLCPPFGAVYCHHGSHINVDECGGPEFFTGGAKLLPLDGEHGKLKADRLDHALGRAGFGVEHHSQPYAVSLTQATEAGTVYRPDEIAALSQLCQSYNLGLHMDGARFANAIATANASPADATWRAGVDVLSFGATKNGAFAAEAVIFFNQRFADNFKFRRKRAGHLLSKMRFIAAQWDAYLTNDVWLRNARHANAMAQRLVSGLAAIEGVAVLYPVEANEIFVTLPDTVSEGLFEAGFEFYPWQDGDDPDTQDAAGGFRLVTAFDTPASAVDDLVATAQDLADQP